MLSMATSNMDLLSIFGKLGYIPPYLGKWNDIMTLILKLDAIKDLPRTPASDVKKLGWRGVMKTINRQGKVVVTNHNEPEAVILSTAEYDAIMQALQKVESRNESALDALRHRFDKRLASLQATDSGDRLRSLMRGHAKLGGKVKVGASY
jgi:prevent-host-death family protein